MFYRQGKSVQCFETPSVMQAAQRAESFGSMIVTICLTTEHSLFVTRVQALSLRYFFCLLSF